MHYVLNILNYFILKNKAFAYKIITNEFIRTDRFCSWSDILRTGVETSNYCHKVYCHVDAMGGDWKHSSILGAFTKL